MGDFMDATRIEHLVDRLTASEARVKELEKKVGVARGALEQSIDAMEMGAFHHNCCPWLNGKECSCAQGYKIPQALDRARQALKEMGE